MFVPQRNQLTAVRQCLMLLVFPALALAAGPGVIDRAVASIEGKVITASQLDFEARVLLINSGGVRAAFEPLDRAALESGLRLMIDQRLALLEADKLDSYPLEPGELDRAIAQFRERLGEEQVGAFLAAHEADLNDLAEVLKRNLRAQRALDGRLRLRAQVSEAEVRAWLAANRSSRASPEQVRSLLMQRRFSELVKAELSEQRKQSDVRMLGPFAPKPAGPP